MDVTTSFLEFFGNRDHRLLQGSSLVPRDGDPVLFTTSGMHPLTSYLEGRPHPQGRRLAGVLLGAGVRSGPGPVAAQTSGGYGWRRR